MIEATKARLAALEQQYAHRNMPVDVKQELRRLQAQLARLERDNEVKP